MCLDKGYDYGEVRRTLAEFGFTAHIPSRGKPESGRGGKGDQAGSRVQGAALSGGTHPQLAEPVSAYSGALRQGPRELHRLPTFRLCSHHPQSRRVIRIGSNASHSLPYRQLLPTPQTQ